MNIAIPVQSENTDATLSMKFARSPFFALVNTEIKKPVFIKNPFFKLKSKVGEQVFSLLTKENKIDAFLAFELGLKVQQMAVNNKIQLIIINSRNQSLKNILNTINRN